MTKCDAGELNVLRPLITATRQELEAKVGTWQKQIKALSLTEERLQLLTDLLIYAITSRFKNISKKELIKMLQLSPIEDSLAFKEFVAEAREEGRELGREEGREEGRELGQIIGVIRLLQELKGLEVQTSEELEELDLDTLKALRDRLKSDMS